MSESSLYNEQAGHNEPSVSREDKSPRVKSRVEAYRPLTDGASIYSFTSMTKIWNRKYVETSLN